MTSRTFHTGTHTCIPITHTHTQHVPTCTCTCTCTYPHMHTTYTHMQHTHTKSHAHSNHTLLVICVIIHTTCGSLRYTHMQHTHTKSHAHSNHTLLVICVIIHTTCGCFVIHFIITIIMPMLSFTSYFILVLLIAVFNNYVWNSLSTIANVNITQHYMKQTIFSNTLVFEHF